MRGRFSRAEAAPPRAMPAVGNDFERYLIYAAVFLSPFINLRTDVVFFTLSDALLSVALASMFVRGRLPRAPLGPLTVSWVAAFVLIAGGLYLSSLRGDLERGAVLTVQYLFCFILLPYALMRDDEDEAYRLLLIFILGIVVMDLHGIVTFYTIGYTPDSQVVTGARRLATVHGNPNGAASLNAIVIVMVPWLRSIRRISATLTACFLSVSVLTLVLTSSNTGLIATVAGLSAFVVCTMRPKTILKVAVVCALAALFFRFGGVDYLPDAFKKRVLVALVEGDISEAGTFASRSALMVEATDMLGGREFSLLGIGADQYRVKSVQGIPVHNSFLILWVEGGMLSLLGWILMCSMGLILWLCELRNRLVTYGSAAAIAVFVVFTVFANATAHVYQRQWYMALLLVMQPTIIALSRRDGGFHVGHRGRPHPQLREITGRDATGPGKHPMPPKAEDRRSPRPTR